MRILWSKQGLIFGGKFWTIWSLQLSGTIGIFQKWSILLELQVKHLAILRHDNLVPLLGYCKDGEHLGLVYEYMAEGNVEQRLRGWWFWPVTAYTHVHMPIRPDVAWWVQNNSCGYVGGTTGQEAPLTWSQRLKIALDSARGTYVSAYNFLVSCKGILLYNYWNILHVEWDVFRNIKLSHHCMYYEISLSKLLSKLVKEPNEKLIE